MNLISDVLASQWFLIALFLWGVVALASKGKRSELKYRLADLITKPTIFHHDDDSNSLPSYPRETLEEIAKAVANTLVEPVEELSDKLNKWASKQRKAISREPDKPWKMFGYLMYFVFLLFFFYADAIAIAYWGISEITK